MSIATRLTLAILVLVTLTAGASWVAVHGIVIRPFAEDVREAHLREIGFAGRRLARGDSPEEIAEDLGLEISPWDRPIPRNWKRRRHAILVPGGPPFQVLLRTPQGVVSVKRDLDLERRVRTVPRVIFVVVLGILVVAVLIARASMQPLRATTEAMVRMGGGDLDHRLPEEGPTELQEASRAFNGLADRVTQLLATERQLLAGISHELRTPLTRLRLETELLRDAGVEGRRLDRIDADLTQLDDLIGEALALSRLQLGTAPLHREPVDLAALARTLGEDLLVEGAGEAEVDRFLVERALQNLVGNARKYAPGSPVHVRVQGTTVTVRDEGPGVPEEELSQLFEPFYRTRQGSQRADGHGLGLMIVRTVAELHGGSVQASNADPGLKITVRLTDPVATD